MSDESTGTDSIGFPRLKSGAMVGPGRFTLIKELGRGGMGVVWLAQDTSLGEQVALKFLPPEVCHDAVALNDLRRETVRSHRLTHPNIVRLHDFHLQPDGVAFISMEYVDGPTLSAYRLQQPMQVLSWEQVEPLLRQLCVALDYAHGEGVIHRDLKPANVMLDSRERVKLADFGIAAVMSDSLSRVSARSSTSGTLAYMSPQQLAGKMPSVADDVYALGTTLYELVTGRPPFHTGDITHQVLHVAPTPVQERLLDLGIDNPVPAEVGALIMACLSKEPDQRPSNAAAAAEWIGGGNAPSALPMADNPVAEAPVSPNRMALWQKLGTSAAITLIMVLLIWLRPDRYTMQRSLTAVEDKTRRVTDARSPNISQLATTPSLPFNGSLQGTIWRMTDSDRDTTWLQFGANGTLIYEAGRGIRRNGKWQQNGDGVNMEINEGFTTLSGSILDGKMEGKALSVTGNSWSWEATAKK